jgi:hypothetical protein
MLKLQVTIGFGDFSPEEEGHYGGWIAFIFIGLILSTLTIDVVGYSYIKRKFHQNYFNDISEINYLLLRGSQSGSWTGLRFDF